MPDYRELAVRYLDAWQEEISATLTNPLWAGHVMTMLELLAQAEVAGQQDEPASRGAGPSARAETPRPSSSDRDRRLDELSRRVAALEGQLRAINENGGGKQPSPRTRRSRGQESGKSAGRGRSGG